MSATPFQPMANDRHHSRSAWNCWFKRTWWCGRWGTHRRSIICLRKDQPGWMSLHACWRVPMRDSSSLLVHVLLLAHRARSAWVRSSLSCSRRRMLASVSSSMPRNVRHVVGPSSLSIARGTPNSVHARRTVSRVCAQSRVKRTAVLHGIPRNCGDFTRFCAAVLRDFAPGNATIAPKTAHERAYNRAKPSVAFALKVTPSISDD